jgi:hypothetical protein
MIISFKLNFHGKSGNYLRDGEEIVGEVFKSILSELNLHPTTDPAVYSFTFGTRILNKIPHVNKKLKEVIRNNNTIKLITKKDMGYS